MSGPAQKRKRHDSNSLSGSLNEHERKLYDAIRNKNNMGISSFDLQRETGIKAALNTKTIKSLLAKNMIKEVKNFGNKSRKHYMAAEFEPSKEITGGAWYNEDGDFDVEFIEKTKKGILSILMQLKVATLEGISGELIKSHLLKIVFSAQELKQIVEAMVLDNKVMKVVSTGVGEFAGIKVGKDCYKHKKGDKGEPKLAAMASLPCGVCPRINLCTPDGIISPATCEYFEKWLDF